MSKARNLSKVIVDSSGIVSRNSLDVETVAKTGSYNDLTNKPTIPSGTVTSVAATVPTGLSVSGSPITSSGTLAFTFASGYSIPTDAKQSNWDTAYSWGNHASAGYQAGDADLTAIAALSGTSGFLKKTAANTWSLDTNTYLTSYTETDPVYTASSWYSTTNNASNWNTAYGWGNHASAGYATYPSQTGNSGKYLTTNGSTTSWATVDALPSQTGNSGKYLTTDGSTASWATINVTPALDDLSDVTITSVASGQVLSYNGTAWVNTTATSNTTSKGLFEHSNTISADYSITSGNNAMTAGSITINSGVTVTVPTGSTWVIV